MIDPDRMVLTMGAPLKFQETCSGVYVGTGEIYVSG